MTEKLCECGCGEETKPARRDDPTRQELKGAPQRFVSGHYFRVFNRLNPTVRGDSNPSWKGGRRTSTNGYILIRAMDHPRSMRGYVYEHILLAERALGRILPATAQVHHVNEIKSENTGGNLVLCENDAYHKLLHRRARAFNATGDANMMKCGFCKRWDHPINLQRVSTRISVAFHAECNRADLSRRKPWIKKVLDCQPTMSQSA